MPGLRRSLATGRKDRSPIQPDHGEGIVTVLTVNTGTTMVVIIGLGYRISHQEHPRSTSSNTLTVTFPIKVREVYRATRSNPVH
jgi:hypothetical protein